jgi:phage-related protein
MPCYFRPDKRVVITHGFTKKKEGAAPKQEFDRAQTIKTEYEGRLTSECRNRRQK